MSTEDLKAACDQGVTNWQQTVCIVALFLMLVGIAWAAAWAVAKIAAAVVDNRPASSEREGQR